jgi:UDP-N-acetylmuramate dehydrogenase
LHDKRSFRAFSLLLVITLTIMIVIQENIPLKKYNTFGMDVCARKFSIVNSIEDLREAISSGILKREPFLLLGGGSNLLLLNDFEGLVLKIENKGIEILSKNEDFIVIKAAAGENWHDFVTWCVTRGYGGIENLSLIPGNVGSSPIQNIGAYGVEIQDSVQSLEVIDTLTCELQLLDRKACNFGYRDSIFKHELKGKSVIWSVTFRLNLNPVVQLEYGAISQELESMGIRNPGIKDVSEAVCNIRRSKLPDPAETGNAGSFFKNPTVSAEKAEMLRAAYPGLVSYYLKDGNVKLAAGWLIEQCRWKGFRRGDAGVHPRQALCIVNYGNASGVEIVNLAEEIQQSVLERFDVLLDIEVNII